MNNEWHEANEPLPVLVSGRDAPLIEQASDGRWRIVEENTGARVTYPEDAGELEGAR